VLLLRAAFRAAFRERGKVPGRDPKEEPNGSFEPVDAWGLITAWEEGPLVFALNAQALAVELHIQRQCPRVVDAVVIG
jgi:hypothetical protein